MSLTYPILNDILADKVDTLSQELNQLCNGLNDHIYNFNKSKMQLDDMIYKQDVKIELIHTLFKHYKDSLSSESKLDNTDVNFNVGLSKIEHTQLVNKLSKSLNKSIEDNHKKLVTRLNNKYNEMKIYIDNSILKIASNNKDIQPKIINDLIYKIDCLEKKYIDLEKKISNNNVKSIDKIETSSDKHIESPRNISDNDFASDSDDDNGNNWIQVSRKYKTKKKI